VKTKTPPLNQDQEQKGSLNIK